MSDISRNLNADRKLLATIYAVQMGQEARGRKLNSSHPFEEVSQISRPQIKRIISWIAALSVTGIFLGALL